ncbi:DNA-binding transcriptional MerR regulator [Murinocardiopsis flavida]|uniref:DNA-binding transcriptional MerR regulator n=1 Tax=Murinocardiopsis flavida TaxID=645275 RepID=A0A2P8DTL3_9ACTN|nr:MerR family transcriptional regulator [Murinocardiopsis flavida]PSL00551.1 DNA-binding transcriptional MerR regulator [Murinocardiopsis flavida]
MGWSTRQLADLAGTSLRTVRHYHDVGLLAEPARRANGYKNYGVEHLVRVMRIQRLSGLGFSLPQIAEMGEADEYPEQELRTLDAELGETIKRLQRVRAELALVMRRASPTELPPEMALAVADADMSTADRSLMVVWSRLTGPEALASFTKAIQNHEAGPADREFEELPADADEQTRRELADRLLPTARGFFESNPELHDPVAMAPKGPRKAAQTLNAAMEDLYNPAQRDVLARVGRMLKADTDPQADR